MRSVLQRVTSASVAVGGEVVGAIGRGLLVLAGCARGDIEDDYRWMARKIGSLRIFPEDKEEGRHFEKSIVEVRGQILVVSQFTVMGDARKGRRPNFSDAMPVAEASSAFAKFADILKEETGLDVQTGRFQEMMTVSLVNDGPVTIILDSRRKW